jgi:hypothetical protein
LFPSGREQSGDLELTAHRFEGKNEEWLSPGSVSRLFHSRKVPGEPKASASEALARKTNVLRVDS